MVIAVDAMGGDNAPQAVIEGALQAAQKGVTIQLFGDQPHLLILLQQLDTNWHKLPLSIVHCSQVIEMSEEPSKAILKKTGSSLIEAMKAVKNGNAQAFVSAGNSGAVLVASTLLLGRVGGILRPALGGFLPTVGNKIFCLDLGANTDCKPEYLEQFALMGYAYVQLVQGIASPRIGLLSNGHEPFKGCALIKEVYSRLEQNSTINFVGNVEARDVFDNKADVLVSDGFIGNIMLKTAQGTIKTLLYWLKQEAKRSWWSKLRLWLNLPILKRLKDRADYAKIGGALLLGVPKPVIVAHGSSQADAIMQAIMFAQQLIYEQRIENFNAIIQNLIPPRAPLMSAMTKKVRGIMAWGHK